MKKHSLHLLEKADTEVKKEQLKQVQMVVWWDIGFKNVTGDRLYLLVKRPEQNFSNHMVSSNSPGGKKWIVTKTVNVDGKPVCWCIPVEVKTGEKIDVTFNEKNTFDLKNVYDKTREEPDDASENK